MEATAQHIAALRLVTQILEDFPGFRDGESDVNGADLVEAFGGKLQESEPLLSLATSIHKRLTED